MNSVCIPYMPEVFMMRFPGCFSLFTAATSPIRYSRGFHVHPAHRNPAAEEGCLTGFVPLRTAAVRRIHAAAEIPAAYAGLPPAAVVIPAAADIINPHAA